MQSSIRNEIELMQHVEHYLLPVDLAQKLFVPV